VEGRSFHIYRSCTRILWTSEAQRSAHQVFSHYWFIKSIIDLTGKIRNSIKNIETVYLRCSNSKSVQTCSNRLQRLSIHCFMKSVRAFFAHSWTRANSFLNVKWHADIDGCKFLKKKSLRIIQIPQHSKIITSMKNGLLNCLLKQDTTVGRLASCGMRRPIDC
jgi:CRISPR/Cas system-associated protein Csx1